MKSLSKILFIRNLRFFNIKYSTFITNFRINSLIKRKLFIESSYKNFSGCSKSDCGCHGAEKQEDELEKKLRGLNQRIIQCINLGNFDDALELSDEYISQIKSNYGDDHPFYCSAVNNKAFILKTCGQYDDAKILFEEVIFKYKKTYGEYNDKVVITKQNLATLYRDSKQIDAAIEIFEKIIDDINSFKVELKPNVMANIFNSVAGCYRVNKNYEEAQESLNKAFNLVKENFGEKNLPMATILNNIGMNHKDQGNFKEALEKYEKALAIRIELLPEGHPDIMAVNHNIGQLYFDFGDKDNATKYFNKNIETMNKKETENKSS